MLARDEVVDHARLQRAGAEQRHERDDVFEAVGLQAADQILHAARFELEHRGGLAALQQLVGRRVVHRQRGDVERRLALALRAAALMIFTAQSMIVSVRRPRKSNFTRPAASTSSLSNCVTTLCAGLVAEQRREIGEHRRRDDHAAGVHAGVAHQAFERHRHVEDARASPPRS